jgi:hypothetical protein
MQRSLAAFVLAAVAVGAVTAARADDPPSNLSAAAQAGAAAERVFQHVDVVSVQNRATAVAPDVRNAAVAAALGARGAWADGSGATVGLRAVRRGAAAVQVAPAGYQFPLNTTVLPLDAVGPMMGGPVASALASGNVVIGSTSAGLRGAQAGDLLDLVAFDGSTVTFTVGAVVDDAVVGGTEILMTPDQASVIGIRLTTRIVMWGFESREAIDAQLAAAGLAARTDVQIRRSWAAPSPDGTLGLAQTKRLLGEFAYRVNSNGIDISVWPDWTNLYMPPEREVLFAGIPIKARCHNLIKADLIAALQEVAAAGLAGAIDVGNANTYGGCYYPRFNRIAGELGFLSRHSWGQALDTNTTTNPQGGTPRMNCDVVRIFRKHNFAWGGNFLTSDGMHFEWVGERRDQWAYPSRYCPNLVQAASSTAAGAGEPGSWPSMFADEGDLLGAE